MPGIRRLIVGDYILDYFPGETIMIVAIRHGRQRDPDQDDDRDEDFEAPPPPGDAAD